MTTHDLKKQGGWVALAAGILGLIGIATLAAFFAFEAKEATQGTPRFQLFGFLSDLIPVFANLCALGVVVVLYRLQRASAPQLSLIAAVAGVTGNLILVITNLLFLFEKISLDQQMSAFF